MGIRVAVAGASGYAGGELLRLIAGHPEFDLVGRDRTPPGRSARSRRTSAAYRPRPRLRRNRPGRSGRRRPGFPRPATRAVAALIAARLRPVKVVDLGADHRLRDGGLGPLLRRRPYRDLDLRPARTVRPAQPDRRREPVAATGCYAAAIILALSPLLAAGAASPDDVVVVAASGTSGAGRAAKAHLLASEVQGDLSPYKVGPHQHVPEIKQATGATSLSFTPVLAPMPRGILATVTARPIGDRRRPPRRARLGVRGRAVCARPAGKRLAAHRSHRRLELLPSASRRRCRLRAVDRGQRAGQPG